MTALPAAWETGGNFRSTSQDLFAWWSITKTALAAAILRLFDAGQVALDAPFRGQPYTMRQLLQHRAGLTNYGGPAYHDAVKRGDPVWSVEELLTRREAERLIYAPGTDWQYSNIGYLFVRQEVERQTGQPLSEALDQLVLSPLGMTSSRIAQTPRDMAATRWGSSGYYDPNWVYHGLLIGPPEDALRLMRGLLEGSFLSGASRSAMLARHDLGGAIPGRPWTKIGYGLGLMMGEMGAAGRAIGHSGVGPDTVSALYAFPDLPGTPVACAFARGIDEAPGEAEALRLARSA